MAPSSPLPVPSKPTMDLLMLSLDLARETSTPSTQPTSRSTRHGRLLPALHTSSPAQDRIVKNMRVCLENGADPCFPLSLMMEPVETTSGEPRRSPLRNSAAERGMAAGPLSPRAASSVTHSAVTTVLHLMVESGCVLGFEVCLSSPNALDFTVTEEERDETVMHTICRVCGADSAESSFPKERNKAQVLQAMFTAIAHRIAMRQNEKAPKSQQDGTAVDSDSNEDSNSDSDSSEDSDADEIDWAYEDYFGHDVLSCAALHQVLHLVWPVVKEISEFRRGQSSSSSSDEDEDARPIVLHSTVSQLDWSLLPTQDQERFNVPNGVVNADTATLMGLVFKTEPPTAEEVRACVLPNTDGALGRSSGNGEEGGALVTYQLGLMKYCPLRSFILRDLVECVEICLESPRGIDFSVTDITPSQQSSSSPVRVEQGDHTTVGMTLLHWICLAKNPSTASRLLRAMVARIAQCRSQDVPPNWAQKDLLGMNFLSRAAYHELLSTVWPIVGILPFFSQSTSPLEVTASVSEADWETLRPDDRPRFQLVEELLRRATIALLQLEHDEDDRVEAHRVTQCVTAGANVVVRPTTTVHGSALAEQGVWRWPPLHYYIARDAAACVEACLQSPGRIEFTVADADGRTPLHWICMAESRESAESMMTLVLQRLRRRDTHGRSGSSGVAQAYDTVDFHQRDALGMDFLSLAAANELLSTLWPLVKDVAALSAFVAEGDVQHHAEVRLVHIQGTVSLWDWDQLSVENQKCFAVPPRDGFVNTATSKLLRQVRQGFPDPRVVAELVMLRSDALPNIPPHPTHTPAAVTADVTYRGGAMPPDASPLFAFISRQALECVFICLHSPRPIDLTGQCEVPGNLRGHHTASSDGAQDPHWGPVSGQAAIRTPLKSGEVSVLHALIFYTKSKSALQDFLQKLASRFMESQRAGPSTPMPKDVYSWESRDSEGRDVFSLAASLGVLHIVWPALKPIYLGASNALRQTTSWRCGATAEAEEMLLLPPLPAFAREGPVRKVRLTVPVLPKDWARMGREEHPFFVTV